MCNTSFRTGDTCWAIYQDQVLPGKIAWSDITPDIETIYGVELPEISIENDAKTFVVELDAELVFRDMNDAKEQCLSRMTKRLQVYQESIHSVQDLLNFALIHPVCGSDCDIIARMVFTEKMKEFGF